MTYDITALVQALISLAVALITTFLVPYLNKKATAEHLDILKIWLEFAVRAAEQLYGSGKGAEKKKYVIDFLATKNITVDDAAVEAMVQKLFGHYGAVKGTAA